MSEELNDPVLIEFDFRYLKLANGDDILCQVPKDAPPDMLLVRYPLKITTIFDARLDEAMYVFTPWIPFTSDELIVINKLSVITITTVREAVKEIYTKKIELYQHQVLRQVSVEGTEELAKEVPVEIVPLQEPDPDEPPKPKAKKPYVN